MNYDLLFEVFGYLGAGCLSIMTIPQVLLTIKTNKTDDLSIKFIIFNLLAVSFLLPYSCYYKIYPILIANCSVGLCNLIILYYCIRNYKRKKSNDSENDDI